MKYYLILGLLIIAKCSFASSFYVDPINGDNITGNGSTSAPWKTLEYVIANNFIESHSYVTPYDSNNSQTIVKNAGAPIKEGDTILLLDGLHGDVFVSNYINQIQITIKALDGHNPIIRKMHFQGAKNWILEDLSISSEPYSNYINDKLIFLESHNWQGPVSNINIKNNHIYSSISPWTTANEWVNNVSNGIIIQGSSNLIENNLIQNIGFGISLQGDFNQCKNNQIVNFSGDGIRVLGSNNLIELNTVKNCYKVDDNHDDGIQSFTTGGLVVDSNVISKNTIINFEDPNQPLLGNLQGIGCFDGPYNNWTIENNIIYVNHWHGISMYGAKNCSIINNTVLDSDLSDNVGPNWILIDDDGSINVSNCLVKNNITNSLSINPSTNTLQSHNLLLTNLTEYQNNFIDHQNFDFNLTSNSSAIDNADSTYYPNTDFIGTTRPQGDNGDIGAYEWISPLNLYDHTEHQIVCYPNPTNSRLYLPQELNNSTIFIYNMTGKKVMEKFYDGNVKSIDVSELPNGLYLLKVTFDNLSSVSKFVVEH